MNASWTARRTSLHVLWSGRGLLVFAVVVVAASALWLCRTRAGLEVQLQLARRVDSSAWRRLVCSLLIRHGRDDPTVRYVVVNELLILSRHDAETVRRICSEAIKGDPQNPYYWYKRGVASMYVCDPSRAASDLEAALRAWDSRPQYDLDFSRRQIEDLLSRLGHQ